MHQDNPTLPDKQVAGGTDAPETDDQKSQRMAIIEAFADIIRARRSDAIQARTASGIEKQWQEDQDHYDGIDDTNRGSVTQKGRSSNDGVREIPKNLENRSTVFLKITRPYVDAAAARVSDMLLPTDDRNFGILPEPRPDLTKLVKDAEEQPPAEPMQAMPPQAAVGGFRGMMGKVFGSGQPAAGMPAAPPPMQMTPAAEAAQTIAKAKASADLAQDEIDDWLVQCRYHAEVRKVIESAAKLGAGILKGPIPVMMRSRAAIQTAEGWTVEMVSKIAPTSKYISQWNFYPDGSCGNDIQSGSYTFECDDITQRRLVELKQDKSYISEMIDMCIDEGPTSPTDGTRKRKEGDRSSERDLYQIWYFHGQVSKKDMEAAGCKCGDKDMYPAIVTMVNDRVIKVTLSALDSGEFPYDVMVWQGKPDHWAGDGVSRQMRECQKGANAAIRNMMDNAGLSAGPQIVINRGKIIPANGKWELTPRKVWYTKSEEDVDDVSKAFMVVSIETRQPELMNLLQFWLKEAEDVTGLPMLLQGQQGNAPKTATGTQIVNNNGSTVLRRIARIFDDRVTEPHIGRYYEFLLLYGSDAAKGQFTVDARGSSALVEREMQAQQLVQMMGMSLNPAYGLDPEQVAAEFLKSMRFDAAKVILSDEKKKEMASRQPPEDPKIVAAKIMAKSRDDATVANAQIRKMEIDTENENDDLDRALAERRATIDMELANRSLTEQRRAQLEDHKVDLATVALKLKTQTDLARQQAMSQVLQPAVEPIGRAPAGQAFFA